MKYTSLLILSIILLISGILCEYSIRQLQEEDNEDELSGTLYGQFELIKDFVGAQTIKYYLIQFYDGASEFDIAVTVLSGSVNIYVDVDSNPKPTSANSRFSSLDHKSIFLQIDYTGYTNNAKYYVGIEGNTPSVYILQVAYKGMSLMGGLPSEYNLLEGEELHMVYNHTDDTDIAILNTRSSGWTEITVGSVHKSTNSAESIYKETYSTKQRFRDIILIDSQFNNPRSFCVDCKYIVSVKALQNCKGSIVIAKQNQPIYLREGYPQQMVLAKGKKQAFILSVGSINDFEINIASLSGILSFELQLFFDGNEIVDFKHEVLKMDHYYTRVSSRYLKCQEGSCSNFPKDLLIILEASQHQFFTLTVKRRTTDITLLEGKHIFSTLLKDESNQFIYHNDIETNKNNSVTILDIKLHIYGDFEEQEYPGINVYIKRDDKDDESEDNVYFEQIVPINQFKRTLDGLFHIQLKAQVGIYHIVLSNSNSQNKLEYSLVVTGRGIRSLRLGEASRDLVKQGESVVYEFFADEQGSLGIEIFECFGSVQVYYALSYKELIAKQIKAFPRSYHRGNLYFHTKFSGPGVRYIIISVLEGVKFYDQSGLGSEYAQFKLQGYFYYQSERDWHEYVIPGGEGMTKWTQTGFKDYEITFQRVLYKPQENDDLYDESDELDEVEEEQKATNNNEAKRILQSSNFGNKQDDPWNPLETYELIIARDPFYLNTIAKCGYCSICAGHEEFLGKLKDVDSYHEIQYLGAFKRFSENQIENGIISSQISLFTFEKSQIYYCTIISYLTSGWNDWPPQMFIIYDRMELTNSLFFFVNRKSYVFSLGLFITILVALVCSCFYYRKYKIARQKLMVSLHDVNSSSVELQMNTTSTESNKNSNQELVNTKIQKKGEYQTMEDES